MSELERPLNQHLSPRVDDLAIERGLRAVMERRDRARGKRPRRVAWIAAPVVAIAAAVLLFLAFGQSRALPAGPLALGGGAPVPTLDAVALWRAEVLSDGSRVELASGTRLEVLENSGTAFTTRLARGRVTCDVVPGGPRRWTIETPLATVDVVGTKFSVERAASGLRVEVERGVVLVRGERVPERVQRLVAGQSLVLAADAATPPAPSSDPSERSAPSATPEEPPETPSPRPSASAAREREREEDRAWEPLAKRGNYKEAFAELGPEGVRAETRRAETPAELLALADVARLSGHPRDAVAPLEKLSAMRGAGAQAAVAAFTLGRIELDDLGEPRKAADAFASSIARGPPESLLEDAFTRLVEARARAGDKDGAASARIEYLARFPNGRGRSKMDAWVKDAL